MYGECKKKEMRLTWGGAWKPANLARTRCSRAAPHQLLASARVYLCVYVWQCLPRYAHQTCGSEVCIVAPLPASRQGPRASPESVD